MDDDTIEASFPTSLSLSSHSLTVQSYKPLLYYVSVYAVRQYHVTCVRLSPTYNRLSHDHHSTPQNHPKNPPPTRPSTRKDRLYIRGFHKGGPPVLILSYNNKLTLHIKLECLPEPTERGRISGKPAPPPPVEAGGGGWVVFSGRRVHLCCLI